MKVEPHPPFAPLSPSLFSLSLSPTPSHFKLSSPLSSITFPLSPSPLPFSSSFFHYILPPSLSLTHRFSQRNSHHFHQHYTRETKERSAMIKPTTTPAFVDEIDCGSFFDNIDDFIDFPSDDVPDPSPPFWPSPSLPPTDSVFSAPELSVPYEDIVQLEWLSNFVEDSFSGESLTINNKQDSSSLNNHSSHQNNFQTSSPVSVLESSSSCSGEKTAPHTPEVVASARRGRARSKRPRPATFTPRPPMQLISPTSSVNESRQPGVPSMVPSDSENFAESRLLIKIPMQIKSEQKKKKKIKFTVPSGPVEVDENSPPVQQAVRKCMHCEITKTPQWRAGPMGPKTLCNACGVRYKSGRLFPEYRPAASPTFVPSLHSNSHKKVLEMRTRVVRDNSLMDGAMMANLPELIPNDSNITMNYI